MLITLTALIFLTTLTGCKTTEYVYIYPEVIEQEIPTEPTHEPWTFEPVEGGQLLSENDSRELYKYILSLKNYADILKIKLQYYIDEVKSWSEK